MLNACYRFQIGHHNSVRNNGRAIVSYQYKEHNDRHCNEPQASLCKESKRLDAELLVTQDKVEIYLLDGDNRALFEVLAEKRPIQPAQAAILQDFEQFGVTELVREVS